MSLIIDEPCEKVVRKHFSDFEQEDPLPFTITPQGIQHKQGWGGSYDYVHMVRCTERELSFIVRHFAGLMKDGTRTTPTGRMRSGVGINMEE